MCYYTCVIAEGVQRECGFHGKPQHIFSQKDKASGPVSDIPHQLSNGAVATLDTNLSQTNEFIQQKLDVLNSQKELDSSLAKMISFPLKPRLIIKHRRGQNVPCCGCHVPFLKSLYRQKR